jgi:hypothetical protein
VPRHAVALDQQIIAGRVDFGPQQLDRAEALRPQAPQELPRRSFSSTFGDAANRLQADSGPRVLGEVNPVGG